MEQYIKKSALVAEIRKRLLPVIRDKHYDEWEEGQDSERIAILDIINTLEVKEVDLEKIIDDYTLPISAQDVKEEPFTQLEKCAKHFFELGLKAKNNQDEWNKANTKPPFTTIVDGNKYSNPMLCYDKFGNYCIAQYVRWHTGHCGWYDNEEEVSITHWKELKAHKGE